MLAATFSLAEIAAALRIAPADALVKFQDPRVTSWFAEIWGERLFGYTKHINSNHPGSDARIDLGAIGRFDISVRCFNRNTIKFQKSKFIGSGRKATTDDLIESVESVERVIVVDLRGFPLLRFIPLDSKALLKLVRMGKLSPSGISPGRFDTWLTDSFSITIQQIDLQHVVAVGQP